MVKSLRDLEVGEEIETPARTVTETDIVNFAALTGDWHPLHTDEEYAKKIGPFGQRISHGTLTFAILTGLMARTAGLFDHLIAFYGIDKLRFTAPTFIGDTIKGKISLKEKSETDKGVLITGKAAIVKVNQNDQTVLVAELKALYKP